jgi:DNA-binding transcriptional ArsR family regulator
VLTERIGPRMGPVASTTGPYAEANLSPGLDSRLDYAIILDMSNNRIKQIERLAAAFAALGNANRLRVFLELAACCADGCRCDAESTMCVGDLGGNVCCAPSTLSHHLKELQHAGLIVCERRGRNIDCCIDREGVAALVGVLRKYIPDQVWAEASATKE